MLPAQTILLDPGHGGEDCGAKIFVGKKNKTKICEKDIALSLAKLIKDYLPKNYRIYLTRSIDREVTLGERAELAEKIKADLFVSIHINSSRSRRSHGFETFYLDNHNDQAVKRVEELENKNGDKKVDTVDKILIDLVIDQTAPRSLKLANTVHSSISNKIKKPFKMTDRGVKPALFFVLALTKRPAILLEAGFLSSPKEASKLRTKKFQEAYARGVAEGIHQYLKKNSDLQLF